MTLTPEQEQRFDERFSNYNAPMKIRDDDGYSITPEPLYSVIKQHMAEEIERAVCAERERIKNEGFKRLKNLHHEDMEVDDGGVYHEVAFVPEINIIHFLESLTPKKEAE